MTKKAKLLIIIPCYREARNLKVNLPFVCSFINSHKINCDLLIVEGEILDDTSAVVRSFQKKYPFVKHVQTHKGKGHQVKTGLSYGDYKYYLFMDADLATPLDYISKFMGHVGRQPELGMVTGIRTKRHGNFMRKIVSSVLNIILRICLGFNQTDTQCGFKLLTRDLRDAVIIKQTNRKWIFDIEYFILANQNKLPILEIPIPDWVNDYEQATLNSPTKFIKDSISSGIELSAIILRSWTGWYKIKSNQRIEKT